MTYDNPWLFRGEVFDSEHIETWFGFVYLITNTLTGRAYVGKKFFKSNRKGRVTKKVKRPKRVIAESDWKTYYGSSDELKADVAALGAEHFTRRILSLHATAGDTNMYEVWWQFQFDVLDSLDKLGKPAYYNSTIGTHWRRSDKPRPRLFSRIDGILKL